MSRRRIFKRSIRVKMTEEETAAINLAIIGKSKSLAQVEDKLAAIKKSLAKIIKDHKADINKMLKQNGDGFKTVSVDCIFRPDFVRKIKEVIRLDTGTVIDVGPLEMEDLQQELEDAIPQEVPVDGEVPGDFAQEDEDPPWPEEGEGEGPAGVGDPGAGGSLP